MDKCREEFEKTFPIPVGMVYDERKGYVAKQKFCHSDNIALYAYIARWDTWQARQSEIDTLKAQVEELKADAERYQWLKYKATGKQLDYLSYLDIEAFGEKVDVWMNKAIQQQKGEK